MRAISTLAVITGVLASKPAFAVAKTVLMASSCIVSSAMHIAMAALVVFFLLFALYRTIQLEKDMERTQVENYMLLLIKVVIYAVAIRLGVEMITFFGVPMKEIAKDMLHCRNGCDLLDAPEIPTCKDMPFERVLRLLLIIAAFFAKVFAILIPVVAYLVLFYKSSTYSYNQVQKGQMSAELAALNVAKDGILFFAFILPYVVLIAFGFGVEYTKIIEWFSKVIMKGGS